MTTRTIFALGLLAVFSKAQAAESFSPAHDQVGPDPAVASKEAELAIQRFQVPDGLKADLWAAEPLLVNPVAFSFDEKGRAYVCETFRLGAGVDDIRGIMPWLDEELACRTVDDRESEMKRHLGDRFADYSKHSERIRLVEDRSGHGKADHASVFAEGFNTPLDGIGAGVIARNGTVWYTDIPNLWQLRDTNGDGVADERTSLHYGFGVRVGFLGHDLHGLAFGPDGKLYFSIGDRGSNIQVAAGKRVGNPDTGCIFRCNPDGSDLEVFAYGLRNPQNLVFDDHGNLFTGDNNSDSGDQSRWVYAVEGGDSGWRVGFQFMEKPYSRGPFNAEKLWYPPFRGQAANIIPPVANIAAGPSGVAYFPGTGLPERYRRHFFLVDFRGGSANSGVHTFTLEPEGAGFTLAHRENFLWRILATDIRFGVDGGLYVSDWVEGWGMPGKGRIYRVHAPELDQDATVLETKRRLAEDLSQQPLEHLAEGLSFPDLRVRQKVQFAMADRGLEAIPSFQRVAQRKSDPLARLHAIWGIGQIAARYREVPPSAVPAMDLLVSLLQDSDPEVRAQAAKVLGENHWSGAFQGLLQALRDQSPRVRFFAALAVGKLGRLEAVPAVLALLRENDNRDPYLRHAGVMALTEIGDMPALLAAARDRSPAVRMGSLLAMRRLQRPEIALFLRDSDPDLVLETARAINDEPINGAMPDLAAFLTDPQFGKVLAKLEAEPGDPDRTGMPSPELTKEALIRRALNASFHLGTAGSARGLVQYASSADAPRNMRVEALEELGDWSHPSGRDRVIGLWRPVAAVRPADAAAQALEPRLAELLKSAPNDVQAALLKTVGRLEMLSADEQVMAVATDPKAGSPVRVAALETLGALRSPHLEEVVSRVQHDSNEDVRRAALRVEAQMRYASSIKHLASVLESGSVGEQQTALAGLSTIPGEAVDQIILQWLDRLRSGRVAKELQLDVLDAARKRSSVRVERRLARYEASRGSQDPLAPYQEVLFGGNAEAGRKLFFERQETQCVRCHKIGGEGGDVGPDLTHIGAQKDRRYLLESMVMPNKQIAPGFESVTVSLKNGNSYAGVLKSETADELVLNSADAGHLTIKKADIESRRASLSPMPEGFGQILAKHDLRDLVEFLATRR